MEKQEIIALIERLCGDQEKYNKFVQYVEDFTSRRRCKKGILAFIEEIFNAPELAGTKELAIQLLGEKSMTNSHAAHKFIMDHPITIGYNTALIDARIVITRAVASYIVAVAERLQNSTLDDKVERQVYLRRAIARFLTLSRSRPLSIVQQDQWHEVEPFPYINYLAATFEEMMALVNNEEEMRAYSDVYYSTMNMDQENVLRSMISYLDYLDTFTEW